jgi:hypothetical protein
MKWALRSGLLAVIAILFAGNVKADTVVVYTLTVGSTTVATFSAPQFPSLAPSTASTYFGYPGMGIIFAPVNLVINGVSSPDTVEFFNSLDGGGIEDIPAVDSGTPAFNLLGGQLYSGDESVSDLLNPAKMSTGSFTLFPCLLLDCSTGVGETPTPYTLSAVPVTVSTPEPSSILLFGTGLFALILVRKRYAVNQPV